MGKQSWLSRCLDVSLMESLANALDVSIIELFTGENIVNTNKSSNMRKMKFYVCPIGMDYFMCQSLNQSYSWLKTNLSLKPFHLRHYQK